MVIDRAIDWDRFPEGYLYDFIDFESGVFLILEADVQYPEHIQDLEKVELSKIKMHPTSRPKVSVESNQSAFTGLRDDWMEEPHEASSHPSIKPDNITWHILKSDAEEHGYDDSNMRAIFRLVFKEK